MRRVSHFTLAGILLTTLCVLAQSGALASGEELELSVGDQNDAGHTRIPAVSDGRVNSHAPAAAFDRFPVSDAELNAAAAADTSLAILKAKLKRLEARLDEAWTRPDVSENYTTGLRAEAAQIDQRIATRITELRRELSIRKWMAAESVDRSEEGLAPVKKPNPKVPLQRELEDQRSQIRSLQVMVQVLSKEVRPTASDALAGVSPRPSLMNSEPVYVPNASQFPVITTAANVEEANRPAETASRSPELPPAIQTDTSPSDPERKLQAQVELQRKQIELLERMVRLLKEQIDKQAPTIEQLRTLTAELDGRSKQAAHRDVELANGIDDVVEHIDAQERTGPSLPAQLHELFLPSGNNETPLSIFGAMAVGFTKMQGSPNGFYYGEFSPDFFLKLNDWILLEAEAALGSENSPSATFLQADFMVNDWLTVIAGRFVAPIGWFNERLNNPWINKLPADAPGSAPLPWMQVLPAMSLMGVQARGSFYLGNSPYKLEYATFVSNGLNVTPATPGSPTADEVANLENMTDTFAVISNDKAYGGRLGLWWPEAGLEAGISAMQSGDYLAGSPDVSMTLWAFDLNYHKGNWDARFEYGANYQQAPSSVVNGNTNTTVPQSNIRREGLYAQVAYRPWDARNKYLSRTEFVYRFGWADFHGIDPNNLVVSSYATPVDVPVRRYQNEFGINYYFYQRMALKFAYQINSQPGFPMNDNQFMSELAWGW